jgi:hypothetical protein
MPQPEETEVLRGLLQREDGESRGVLPALLKLKKHLFRPLGVGTL